MKFSDLSTIDKIDWATRNIIVLSIIYYDLNETIVSDVVYDKRLKYLCNLVNNNRDIIDKCYYYNVIKDIDPSTGFDLADKLTLEHRKYLTHIGEHLIKLKKMEGSNK